MSDYDVTQENIKVPQGGTKVIRFITRGVDGEFYDPNAFRMQARTAVGGTAVLSLTEASSEVTLSVTGQGYVLVTLDDTVTEGIAAGDYVYDAEAREPNSGQWFRIAEGAFCVTANVTV